MRLALALVTLFVCASASAQTMYRCGTRFQDTPCDPSQVKPIAIEDVPPPATAKPETAKEPARPGAPQRIERKAPRDPSAKTPSEVARACFSWKMKDACAEFERMRGECGRSGADEAKCEEVERLMDARVKSQVEQAKQSMARDQVEYARRCAQTGDKQMCMLAACYKANKEPTQENKAACAAHRQ